MEVQIKRSLRQYSIPPLVHVALVAFIALQPFDVFVRLLFAFASLFLNNLAQGRIDVLGHAPRITANEEVRTLRLHPFPNRFPLLQICAKRGNACAGSREPAIDDELSGKWI